MTREAAVSLLAAWLSCWAAEERALPTCTTMGGNNDEISFYLGRELADLIERPAGADVKGGVKGGVKAVATG